MDKQGELEVFLTHEDGVQTVAYLTVALRKEPNGTLVIHTKMYPDNEGDDLRPIVVRHSVSVAHCIELCTAAISGRLVRDFTRQGRVP